MTIDILYCEGPGDIVAAYRAWKAGQDFTTETSVTFSSQLFEFCRRESLTYHALSYCSRADRVEDSEGNVISNVPRWNIRIRKIGYELTVALFALRLLLIALRVRPQTIVICSGVTDWAYLPLLRLSGARIVPLMHNTLWPEGFRPKMGLRQRVYQLVWKRFVWATLAVSQACARQVHALGAGIVTVFRPSFPAASFAPLPVSADFASMPFRVMYAGRLEQNKGVFDILAMAKRLPHIEFSICGTGTALTEVKLQIETQGLANVTTHGQLARPQLLEQYRAAHVVIVPTRSNFEEGLAMVVLEALLLLRPVITSPVVPAAEEFAGAIECVATDDVDAYVAAIRMLSMNAARYADLVDSARGLRRLILDDSTSLPAQLHVLFGKPKTATHPAQLGFPAPSSIWQLSDGKPARPSGSRNTNEWHPHMDSNPGRIRERDTGAEVR